MAEPTYQPRLWHLIVDRRRRPCSAPSSSGWSSIRGSPTTIATTTSTARWSCFPRLISHFYPLGEPVSFVKDRPGYERDTIRWCGFMPAKNDGIKSFGDYGILKFKFDIPDEDLLLTFSSWANTSSEQARARLSPSIVNGHRCGHHHLQGRQARQWRLHHSRKPSRSRRQDGMVEIRWEVPVTGPPGTNTEPVTLQVRLEAVRLVPVSKAPPPATTPIARAHTQSATIHAGFGPAK